MSRQLGLFEGLQEQAQDGWRTGCGALTVQPHFYKDGQGEDAYIHGSYVHLIRAAQDPERLSRKEQRAKGAGFEAWKDDLKGDPEDWMDRIVELLQDGIARTFNRIVLDLTGRLYTADVAGDKPPDVGLWYAVSLGLVERTTSVPIYFRRTTK